LRSMQRVFKAAASFSFDDLGDKQLTVRIKGWPDNFIAIKFAINRSILKRGKLRGIIGSFPPNTHETPSPVIGGWFGPGKRTVLDDTMIESQHALCRLETVKILVEQNGYRMP